MKQVSIYTTPTCHFCHLAKEYFKENGIEYTEYNVAEDRDKAIEMIEKTEQRGVPVIFIDDEFVVGFDQPKIASLLGIS